MKCRKAEWASYTIETGDSIPLENGMSLKFESTATRPDSWHFNCWPSAELYVLLSKCQVMPLHIAHMKEGLIPLHFFQPDLHISTGSLCLSWHNWGRCGKDWAGDTVAVYASCTKPARRLEYLSFHFSPSQKGRERRATAASDLLHLHSTSDIETHSPWHLVCHWKKILTQEHKVFDISHF